jgi:hypothetical protein
VLPPGIDPETVRLVAQWKTDVQSIYDKIPLNYSWTEKYFRQKFEKIKTHFWFNNFLPKIVPFMR